MKKHRMRLTCTVHDMQCSRIICMKITMDIECIHSVEQKLVVSIRLIHKRDVEIVHDNFDENSKVSVFKILFRRFVILNVYCLEYIHMTMC